MLVCANMRAWCTVAGKPSNTYPLATTSCFCTRAAKHCIKRSAFPLVVNLVVAAMCRQQGRDAWWTGSMAQAKTFSGVK